MKFAVLDIETDSTGHPTDLGVYDGSVYFYSSTVEQTVDYILKMPVDAIYAHYGIGFDFAVIYSELLRRVTSFDLAMAGSAGVFITIKVGKKTLHLLDSCRLMPASLSKLGKQFDVKTPKKDLDGIMPWLLSVEDRKEYLEADCYCLYQVLESFWSSIDSTFGVNRKGKPFRSKTLASLSLKLFCDKYTKAGKIFNPYKEQADDEQRSYFGGLVYVGAEHSYLYDNVNVYDVNSMYPSVMSSFKYPYSYHRSRVDKFIKNSVALWRCEYEFFNGIPFIFDIKSRSLSFSGECVIDSDTFSYVISRGGYLKILEGYIYERTDYIFKKYIQDCYTMRQKFGNDSAMGYVSKILMNSLYGKFGEKSLKRSLSTKEPTNCEYSIYANGSVYNSVEIFDYESERYIQHRFPAIASFVTLRSRLLLKKTIDIQGDNFLYCDTDCIHTIGEAVDIDISNKLGAFKKEFTGAAMYKGKKSYQLYNTDGTIAKTVLKGIPASARTELDFREMIDDNPVVHFTGYTSLLALIKGSSKEFKRTDKTRTVRDTDRRL